MHFLKRRLKKYHLYQPYSQQISSELVRLLYQHAFTMTHLIAATVLVLTLLPETSVLKSISWYSYMLFVSVLRIRLTKAYSRELASLYEPLWHRRFVILIAATAFGWAFASTFFSSTNDIYEVFIACIITGIAGVAIPFYSASRLAVFVFIVPILLSFSLWCSWNGSHNSTLLGVLTFIYLLLLIYAAIKTHRSIVASVQLKLSQAQLTANLLQTQKNYEQMNHQLRSEIIEREQIEKLLRESEEQYHMVTDALPALIAYVDTQFYYRFVNKAYESLLAKSQPEIIGTSVQEVLGETAFNVFKEYFARVATEKQVTYETLMSFGAEEERYVSVTLIADMKQGVMQGVYSLISDMTSRMNYLATHDVLTGLPNRRFFLERCEHAIKRAERYHLQLAILFLDVDHFKNVNDSLGHAAGDELLIKVGERLKECLREVDTVARLGGDEFVIMLEDVHDKEKVAAVAAKLCLVFSSPFVINKQNIFVTSSIGISFYPDDAKDIQVLFKNADMAMYRAKEQGRNGYQFYTCEINKKIAKKAKLINELRLAIEKEEFVLYYQPLFNIQQNKLEGVEALLRWKHPKLGMIAPGDFVSAAEETGLIVPIGEWAIRSVCAQRQIWDKHQVNTGRIAINLSARQFREEKLADKITEFLKERGVTGEQITLEITEGLVMHDVSLSATILHALRDMGILIVIDDFGTGYSSLNYLKRFPIDGIKIDRSFVTDLTENEDDSAIVTAIIAMAQSMKMKVVAEGVETVAQYEYLQRSGCDAIQGYLVSHPLSADALNAFLKQPDSFIHEGLRAGKISVPPTV